MKLEFLLIPTTDLGASLALYRDVLGFTELWREGDTTAALAVGFDFAVAEGFLHLLDTPPAGSDGDGLTEMLTAITPHASPILAPMLAAAWRAALAAVASGAEPEDARSALHALTFRIPS